MKAQIAAFAGTAFTSSPRLCHTIALTTLCLLLGASTSFPSARIALVIGVASYRPDSLGGRHSLNNSVNDARLVADALTHLGIELIAAYSPEARGRSERMFGMLQGRLPQETAGGGDHRMEAANHWLKAVFLPDYNRRFGVKPEEEGSAFVIKPGSIPPSRCASRSARSITTTPCATEKLCLQIPADRHRHHYVKCKVRVHEYPSGDLAVFHGPRCLARYDEKGQTREEQQLKAAA